MSAVAPVELQPRILIVDDNAAIHEDFRKILGSQSAAESRLSKAENALFGKSGDTVERISFRIDSAFQGQEALKLIEEAANQNDPYSLAFVDVRMPPGWDGIQTLEQVWKSSPDLQAVICTAYSDYTWDDLIRRFGQKDNLIILKKPFETVEVLQIAHAMTRKWQLASQARLRMEDLDRMVHERTQKLQQEIEERTRVQEQLRLSEERFSKAFQASPLPMAIKSLPEGRFLDANSSFLSLTGYAAEELTGHTSDELHLWEDAAGRKKIADESDNRVRNYPAGVRCHDNTVRNTLLWTEPIVLDSKPSLLVILEDVTGQLKMEAQLRQSQKMEVVGRLTSSVAHEFNNLLTVIQGHASLLKDKQITGSIAADCIERIVQASQRAAAFTGQLLAFSRKQPLMQLKSVNLFETVRNMRKMLSQLLGERFELEMDGDSSVPFTRVNDGGVEQMLVNLVLNARDSMTNGGKIWVTIGQETLDKAAANRHSDARAGRFVFLTVMDTGCGMSKELLARIFDPFFTTKEVGKGTGLGLSTVLSIVQQHQGWVEVTSQPSHGSTFKVFLPVWEEAPVPVNIEAMPPEPERGGGETVLVVEDDASVRELSRVALEQGGYRVLEATDGEQALEVWEQNRAAIVLLVTDVVMPKGLNGGALAKTLQDGNPALRVIYTSGYNPEFIKKDLPSTRDTVFIAKPYETRTLLKAVKQSLESVNKDVQKQTGPKDSKFLASAI